MKSKFWPEISARVAAVTVPGVLFVGALLLSADAEAARWLRTECIRGVSSDVCVLEDSEDFKLSSLTTFNLHFHSQGNTATAKACISYRTTSGGACGGQVTANHGDAVFSSSHRSYWTSSYWGHLPYVHATADVQGMYLYSPTTVSSSPTRKYSAWQSAHVNDVAGDYWSDHRNFAWVDSTTLRASTIRFVDVSFEQSTSGSGHFQTKACYVYWNTAGGGCTSTQTSGYISSGGTGTISISDPWTSASATDFKYLVGLGSSGYATGKGVAVRK